MPSGFYQINLPATGMPYADYWYCILWSDDNTQSSSYYSKTVFAINANNDELWYLRITNSVKGKWTKVSNATPPQEFNLPLAEGVSGLAKYSKDQFGRVQLRGWITGATANSVVATLPSGFRLASEAHFIQAISSSTQNGIARVVVRTDGTVYVELPQNGTLASGLSLQLSFAAAS